MVAEDLGMVCDIGFLIKKIDRTNMLGRRRGFDNQKKEVASFLQSKVVVVTCNRCVITIE